MANNRYLKEHLVSLFEQRISLKAAFPESKCKIDKNTLIWTAKIKPTAFSREYKVIVWFKLWKSPTVWVVGDELQNLDAVDFPHKYDIDPKKKIVEVCLYRRKEFSSYKYLSKTIIPWTIEWLYYYEIWLATGEWCGGGEHPDNEQEKRCDKSKQSNN